MSDEHDMAEPQPVQPLDFEFSWRNSDAPNGFYAGITGSELDGDAMKMYRGEDEVWIINMREVVAIKITKHTP